MTDNERLTIEWVNNYRSVIEAPPIEVLPEGMARSVTSDPIAQALKTNDGYTDVHIVPRRSSFGGYAGYCRLQYNNMSITTDLPPYVSELILDWDKDKRYGETINPSSETDGGESAEDVEFDITDLYTETPSSTESRVIIE